MTSESLSLLDTVVSPAGGEQLTGCMQRVHSSTVIIPKVPAELLLLTHPVPEA